MNPETIPTKAAGNPANQTVASPKLRDEFHAAARLRHLAFRTEEAYWDWVVRYLKFHRDQAGTWQHPRVRLALIPGFSQPASAWSAVIDALMPFKNVTVFYGHVHHENHFNTGHITHHSALSTMFPLSPVGSMPEKTQLPWTPSQPFKGLGFRTVQATASGAAQQAREIPFAKA